MKKYLFFIVIVSSAVFMWREGFFDSQQIQTKVEKSGKIESISLKNKAENSVEPLVNQGLTEVADSILATPLLQKNETESKPISSGNASLKKDVIMRASVPADVEKSNIPTPDELYAQQINNMQGQDELPPTIPDMAVIPDELRRIEEAYAKNASQDNKNLIYEEPLPDNPDQPYQSETLVELPAAEDYEPVIPTELQQLEQAYDAGILQQQTSINVDILYDNPDTLEISDPLYYEPPIESEINADIE